MTAYGRAHCTTEGGLFLIEIHSINRKALDISIHLPKEFLVLDMELRKWISKVVKRGSITIRVTREDPSRSMFGTSEIDSLKQLLSRWKDMALVLGYDENEPIPFTFLINYAASTNKGVEVEVNEEVKKELFLSFEKALGEFLAMKGVEGEILLKDVKNRIETASTYIDKIEETSKMAPMQYQERLLNRLEGLRAINEEDKDRFLRELVIFSDRLDVTEELIRLRSHFSQFNESIHSEKDQIGRELDFLLQEMNREVNTIASKSQNVEITKSTLFIKSELEKVREQIQNIE